MKYIIISYHFYPEITPRAFRAFELVKALNKRGHQVTVIIPNNDFDYNTVLELDGVKFINIKCKKNKKNYENKRRKSSSRIKNFIIVKMILELLKRIMIYFTAVGSLSKILEFYSYNIYKSIKNPLNADIVISVGLPFSSHLGTYLLRRGLKINAITFIADYGDPFSVNPVLNIAPYFYFIEKVVLKYFDYIIIPVEEAKEGFLSLVSGEKIRVIPQGYDFSQIEIAEYNENEIISFAYAGIFYENIRNPLNFFNFLKTIDIDFRFYIYTNCRDLLMFKGVEDVVLELEKKIILKDMIERKECIKVLSKMDFLINQLNQSEIQKPSKLIDYGLTKRPIFEYSQDNIDKERFTKFLNKNYSKGSYYEINQYNINFIAEKFEALLNKDC